MTSTWTGDNLVLLKSWPDDCVDLIYLDPPFRTEKDWGQFDDRWGNVDAYIAFLHERVVEMKRILKPTGSFYLHCDPTSSHYIKVMLDSIFGIQQFRNEITWAYGKWTNASRNYQRNSDSLLFYAGNKYTFNVEYVMTETKQKLIDKGYWSNTNNAGVRQLLVYDWDKTPQSVLDDPKYHKIADMSKKPQGVALNQVWTDIPYIRHNAKEFIDYPTQKPLKLLERIINVSSNPGDLVLDPFCGSGTTLVAAKKLNRRYFGIDVNPDAIRIANERLV